MESSESVSDWGGSSQNYSGKKSYVKVDVSEYSKFKIFQNNKEIKILKEFKANLADEIKALGEKSPILKKMGQAKMKEVSDKIEALKQDNAELARNVIDDENENL